MSLAAILGVGPFEDASWAVTPEIDPANVALVGLRDLDDAEKGLIRESDVTAYTMSDIDDRGLRTSLTTPSPSPRRGPTASTSTSIWTGSTRRRPPASARRSAAASPIARPTSPWSTSRTGRPAPLVRNRRGEPHPRPAQPDRGTGLRTRRKRVREADSLTGSAIQSPRTACGAPGRRRPWRRGRASRPSR